LKKVLKWLAVIVILLVVGIQFKRPVRTNPTFDQSQTIEAHVQMAPPAKMILDRACNDCHSNKTEWPWYTNVAPLSWWIADHVEEGRKHLNISEWGTLDPDRQRKKLQQICDEVEDGSMPLSSYLPLHPKAKLSDADKKTLCEWTEAERTRLSNATK
jgi:Haem-binding domain